MQGKGALCPCFLAVEEGIHGALPKGNAPEDHGRGLLNGFQALAQETGVSMPKLDVVSCSVLKSDRLANYKGHGFGLCFADLLGGQRGKLLGWLHP